MMHDLEMFQKAIRKSHRCDSPYIGSVAATEKFGDQIAWQGTVEIFDLIGHFEAKLT
jgi:hypothetical protein